jgi:hypothetical protein
MIQAHRPMIVDGKKMKQQKLNQKTANTYQRLWYLYLRHKLRYSDSLSETMEMLVFTIEQYLWFIQGEPTEISNSIMFHFVGDKYRMFRWNHIRVGM